MAIQVFVNGGAGRMGRRILALLLEDPELELAGVREAEGNPAVGRDAGDLAGVGEIGVTVTSTREGIPAGAQAVVDFTTPEATLLLAEEAGAKGIPMVIGTTGLGESDRERLAGLLEEVAWVMAPNMSVGVNVLFKIAGDVARTLGADYDIEIVEAHHRFKRDAPSGTALRLGEEVARARGEVLEERARYGRQGICGAREAGEIGILAVRAGDIVGEHTVIFGGMGERIELVHRAHSRDNFALGALRAVKWVVGRPAGRYDMMDVLGLR